MSGFTLSKDELGRLDPLVLHDKGWLNDNLIEAISSLLTKKKQVYILPCQVSYHICIQGRIDILTRTTTLSRNKYIIGFNNIYTNKHWSLFCVVLESKKVYYLDPMGASEMDKKNALKKWLNFIKSRKDFSEVGWELGNFEHDLQNDSFNCGVICLKFMETLLQGVTDNHAKSLVCKYDDV